MRSTDGRPDAGAFRRLRTRRSVLFGAALAAGIAVTIPASAAPPAARPTATQPAAIPAKWVGTWRLVSENLEDQNGVTVGAIYPDPVGKLTYTPRGDIWTIVATRAAFEAGTATWYTATAEVHRKAGEVIHHIQASSVPNLIGADQVRGFHFSDHGKQLTLTVQFDSGMTDFLRWRKVGARWAGPL
jgi:Lipocalin-like domain